MDMHGRIEHIPKKVKCDDEEEKAKDVGILLKAIRAVRKANQMRMTTIKKVEGVVAKHPDLAVLLEIVKPITSIIESTLRRSAMPSVASKETNMKTLPDLSQKKIYLHIYVNTLSIHIFVCTICKH